MNTIERVMRIMTQVNIGATLGMAAWLAWSGIRVVGAEIVTPNRPPGGVAAQGVPQHQLAQLPCCFVPATRRAPPTPHAASALRHGAAEVET